MLAVSSPWVPVGAVAAIVAFILPLVRWAVRSAVYDAIDGRTKDKFDDLNHKVDKGLATVSDRLSTIEQNAALRANSGPPHP